VNGGTPTLTLFTGSPATTSVGYVSGSGTTALTFNYTVAAGNTAPDLDYATTAALELNGAAISDAAGNNATPTLATPGATGSLSASRNLRIDTTDPTLASMVRTGPSQSVRAGPLSWTVTFSEPVSGVVTANFALTTNPGIIGTPTITSVTASGGSPSATWTVLTSEAGVTGSDVGSIGLNLTSRAGITDAATNALSAALPITGQLYTYDTTAPTVTSVSSPLANGTYRAGQVVPVTVTFSEPVTVSTSGGTPTLTLTTGSPATTQVGYSSGSGSTTLTFTYTVAAGNTSADLDYSTTTALALNGGAITDAATNNATLTLATPGTAGSLSANKNLGIDTTAPTVTVTAISNVLGLVRVSGTGEAGGGPVTVYLCKNVGPPCDAATSTQTFTNVSISTGSWTTGWSAQGTQGTWYSSATQTDAVGNIGTSGVFGPVTY
jgi:hypothetical protein